MIVDTIAVTALAVIVVAQQLFFMRQINGLVNKIMAGDYHSYVRTEKPQATQTRIPVPQDPPEDLRILQDFRV